MKAAFSLENPVHKVQKRKNKEKLFHQIQKEWWKEKEKNLETPHFLKSEMPNHRSVLLKIMNWCMKDNEASPSRLCLKKHDCHCG